jgi:hypothetical protein
MTTKKNKKRKSIKNKTHKIRNPVISFNFDSGSINVLSTKLGENVCRFNLSLQKETIKEGNKSQYWFYFKVSNVKQKLCYFSIHTHNDCNNGFKNLKVATSYDNKKWFRYKTTQQNKNAKCKINNKTISVKSTQILKWKIKPTKKTIWFAYYKPYPLERIYKLTKQISNKSYFKKKIIGYSEGNKPIHMLTIGNGCRNVWLIGRQHPGESIASWIIEGFLKSTFSPISSLKIHIIPTLNPDGIYLGYWYTNKKGINLNLDWKHKKSKEVNILNNLLKKQHNDLILDIHGDEECKKHFLSHCPKRNIDLYNNINKLLCKYNKHFQKEDYYKKLNFPCDGKTLDYTTNALTLEGSMKHNLGDINNEGINIGKSLHKLLINLYSS